MRRERKLMILSGLLVVCVAGAILLSRVDFEEKMTGKETQIVETDSDKITYLAWNYEGDQLAFDHEDGKWTYASDAKMSVDQDLLDEIAGNLSSITSDKMVEEPQSPSVYGLADPAYNITIETADDSWEIAVGDETFSDGEVYISNGDDYVYLTDSSLIDHISYTLLDCVQKETIPEMENITEVRVDNEDTVDMVYKENAGYCYSDAYTYYLKDGDTYRNLDNTETKNTFTTLAELAWDGCVDYYADDTELKSYGLLDPAATAAITYQPEGEEAKTFTFEVGTANDAYYGKLADSSMVYSISQEVYNAAVNASYDQLKPYELILLDWDTVDSIELELDGNVYTVEVEKEGDEEYSYQYQDSEISLGDALDNLLDLTVSDDENVPEEEPALSGNKSELKLTFHRNTDKYKTVELELYQYDGSYCISVLNGEEMHYTSRSGVASLKEAINSAILDSAAAE